MNTSSMFEGMKMLNSENNAVDMTCTQTKSTKYASLLRTCIQYSLQHHIA